MIYHGSDTSRFTMLYTPFGAIFYCGKTNRRGFRDLYEKHFLPLDIWIQCSNAAHFPNSKIFQFPTIQTGFADKSDDIVC